MTFTMTNEHLALLRAMYVGWQDCEYGAPEIDPKRPYGNSNGVYGVARVLGVPVNKDLDDYGIPETERDRLQRLHGETATALQIVLIVGEFKAGRYRKTDHYRSRSWVYEGP